MANPRCTSLLLLCITLLLTSAEPQEMEKINCSRADADSITGCTSKFLLPHRPFMVIWNHPSGNCEAHGIDLNLSAWDIVENSKDRFSGDNMVIYYGLGHWPKLDKSGKVMSNGGVPQRGSLSYHLDRAKSQILSSTKPGFDGVSVIDMEDWRPNFNHNFDSLKQYKIVSENIVKARYPHLNKSAVEQEAAREFDRGARSFMEGTLNLTHNLRPGGHWGFYGFPRKWGSDSNDKLDWLWRNCRGLFPRIYMSRSSPVSKGEKYVRSQVKETLRVWAKFSSPDTLILPYSLSQNGGSSFFSLKNLSVAIGLPGKMGASGVVLWGSSSAFHTHDECQLLQKYVRTTLGPYVKNLTQFLSNCSTVYCSAHGRCVEKRFEMLVQQERLRSQRNMQCLNPKLLMEMGVGNKGSGLGGNDREDVWGDGLSRSSSSSSPYQNYVCRCLRGWTGEHCEKKRMCGRK